MDAPADVVRSFFECMEARDWSGAGERLSPTIRIDYTQTDERFDGPNFLAMNQAYPDGWSIEVVETLASSDRVAAQVRVTLGETAFWCAGFYTVSDGLITEGVEHWVTEHAELPPDWRRPFVSS